MLCSTSFISTARCTGVTHNVADAYLLTILADICINQCCGYCVVCSVYNDLEDSVGHTLYLNITIMLYFT